MTFSAEEILEYRREKDAAFRADSDSPLSPVERTRFGGLHYYPPDAAYYVPSRLVPEEAARRVVMPTSVGDEASYLVAGRFDFKIGPDAGRLWAFRQNDSDPDLFIPFKDATAPRETYGAGRYLDLPHRPDQLVFLDFNLAYNPYCASNDEFSCPFPPAENVLPFPIRAGERNYRTFE